MIEEAVIVSEENADSAVRKKMRLLQRLGPVVAGLLSFTLGILFFLPLNSIGREALRYASAAGIQFDVENIDLSVFGFYKLEGINIPIEAKAGRFEKNIAPPKATITEVHGRISPISLLLGNKLVFHSEINDLRYHKGDLKVFGGVWRLEANVNNIQKLSNQLNGLFSLEFEGLQLSFKETQYIREEIGLILAMAKISGKIMNGNFNIESGVISGKMLSADIKGSVNLAQNVDLNLTITIKPTNDFYEKYNDIGIKELLKLGRLLRDDGKIELTIRGPISAPVIAPTLVSVPVTPAMLP